MQTLVQQVWGGAQDSALLTGSQVLVVPLVLRPHAEGPSHSQHLNTSVTGILGSLLPGPLTPIREIMSTSFWLTCPILCLHSTFQIYSWSRLGSTSTKYSITADLKQHGFKLCWSTYTQIFFQLTFAVQSWVVQGWTNWPLGICVCGEMT